MTDGVFSPDGNWMWTGDEWIPAPPKSEPEPAPESEGTSETEDNYSTDELPVQAESPIIEPVPPRPPMPAPMPAPTLLTENDCSLYTGPKNRQTGMVVLVFVGLSGLLLWPILFIA